MKGFLISIVPSAGALFLLWVALRAIFQADRRERAAMARLDVQSARSGSAESESASGASRARAAGSRVQEGGTGAGEGGSGSEIVAGGEAPVDD